jgi:hypothetical protein
MAYRFIENRMNGEAIIHAAANTGDIIVLGNNSVSNLCANSTSGEVISGAMIQRLEWGSDGVWKVYRGANLIFVLSGTDAIEGGGMAVNLDPAANITANCTSANCFIIMEIEKLFSAYNSPAGY